MSSQRSADKASSKAFRYLRTIRFAETDAAGVVYFANLLTLCHEAYEAALAAAGIDLSLFFSQKNSVAVPIVHTAADFYQPLRCGDAIAVHLLPTQLDADTFEIRYDILPPEQTQSQKKEAEISRVSQKKPEKRAIATALTRHVCINPTTQRRHPLPVELVKWISSLQV